MKKTLRSKSSLFLSFKKERLLFEKRSKNFYLFGFVFMLVPGVALAQTAPIEALDAGLAQAEKTGSEPFQKRFDALAPVVDKAFNLQQILKTIVGLRWSQIPADQQAKLLAVFRAFTVGSYVSNFNGGTATFRVLPETRAVGDDKVVETEIVPPDGEPARMDYVMRQGPAGWQAVDVLQQGTISQAAVQRSDFRALLSDGGAPKLIESLQQKVDAMSAASTKK
jgi:phospholipid transport system substrate-binding protein